MDRIVCMPFEKGCLLFLIQQEKIRIAIVHINVFIDCASVYNQIWCENVSPVLGQAYYGRGWFQISYPCNYAAAGKALSLNLLENPDLVSQRQDLAVKTAIWFYRANKMYEPARKGDFAATTQIINGAQECNGGQGAQKQKTRVATYIRTRNCFNLGPATINPTC
jgi:hypothetical protein